MAKTLPRLSRKYLDHPQLITASKFKDIADVLCASDRSVYRAAYHAALEFDPEENLIESADCALFGEYYTARAEGSQVPYGVLDVNGTLTYKLTGWEAWCGGCSYTELVSQMESFVEEGLDEVFMIIDSPGGEAYGMMEAALTIRQLADDNDIKLIGYIDGLCASAGYGLASVCHELISNPQSETGSIGVVVSLMNDSKYLEEKGFERIFVTAGDSKVPFANDGSFKDSFLADLQEKVDVLYESFTSHVATYREGLTQEIAKSTEAKVFLSSKALEYNLIDKVMELRDFKKEYLGKYSEDKKETKTNSNNSLKEILMSDTTVNDAELSNEALAKQLAEMQSKLAAYEAKEIEAEKKELSDMLDANPFLADCKDDLMTFLMSDADKSAKTLMSKVIDSASTKMTVMEDNLKKELASVKEEADGKVEAATKELEKVKSEFATTTHSVQEEVAEPKTSTKSMKLADFLKEQNTK